MHDPVMLAWKASFYCCSPPGKVPEKKNNVHDPVMLAWKASFYCYFPPGQVKKKKHSVHDPVMRAWWASLQCWFQELACCRTICTIFGNCHFPLSGDFLFHVLYLLWFRFSVVCCNDVAVRFRFSVLFGTVYKGWLMAGLVGH